MLTDYYEVSGSAPDWSRIDLYGYPVTDYEIEFSFESGDDFRQFRRSWKTAYRELAQLIRESRNAFRQRYRSAPGLVRWREKWRAVRTYCLDAGLDAPTLEDDVLRWPLKAHARFMMNLLRQAKESRLATQ